MIQQNLPIFVFDQDGDLIRCSRTTLSDLVQSVTSVRKIRIGSETDKITTAMRNLVSTLHELRRCSEDDIFSDLFCSASKDYKEVREAGRWRIPVGLSPNESILILIFTSPWVGECIVRAISELISHFCSCR